MNKYIVEYTSNIREDVIIEGYSIEEAKIQFQKEFSEYKIDDIYLFSPCNEYSEVAI